MTKEELEKEAREYLAEHSKYSEVFGEFFVAVDTLTAMVDFAEPREKQIEIDAKQIRALQKQNGELTDKVKELEAQIIRMRNCQNCNNQGEDWYGNFCCKINKSAWNCDSWEMEK